VHKQLNVDFTLDNAVQFARKMGYIEENEE